MLKAAVETVIEHGYAGATVDAVARAAGTGKAAVYRRWPSKSALFIAAVQSLQAKPTVPDTGTLRGDLLACARHDTRSDRRAAHVLASLLGEVKSDLELGRAAYEAIGRPPADAFTAVAFRDVILHSRSLDTATVTRLVDGVLLPALGLTPDAAGGTDRR